MKNKLFSIILAALSLTMATTATAAPVSDDDNPVVSEKPVSMYNVEKKPEFPGGLEAMFEWLGENVVYPPEAKEEGAQGKVFLQFIIEKDGSVSNVKVLRGKHPALDAEAVRVIKAMPKWTPGQMNGQPVRVVQLLPITFKL